MRGWILLWWARVPIKAICRFLGRRCTLLLTKTTNFWVGSSKSRVTGLRRFVVLDVTSCSLNRPFLRLGGITILSLLRRSVTRSFLSGLSTKREEISRILTSILTWFLTSPKLEAFGNIMRSFLVAVAVLRFQTGWRYGCRWIWTSTLWHFTWTGGRLLRLWSNRTCVGRDWWLTCRSTTVGMWCIGMIGLLNYSDCIYFLLCFWLLVGDRFSDCFF